MIVQQVGGPGLFAVCDRCKKVCTEVEQQGTGHIVRDPKSGFTLFRQSGHYCSPCDDEQSIAESWAMIESHPYYGG